MTDAERFKWQQYIRERTQFDPKTGCWNWLLFTDKGYGQSRAARKAGHGQLAHRLSYKAFIEPIPDGLVARHQCHNNGCCNPAHLRIGTHLDNKADDRRDGRRHGTAKLTEAQVLETKRLLAMCIYTRVQIGAMVGASRYAVSDIALGKTWEHTNR